MSECECGCGKKTAGGNFLPGHDQILRANLESKVGGILSLRDLLQLVESYSKGELSLNDFGIAIKKYFDEKMCIKGDVVK